MGDSLDMSTASFVSRGLTDSQHTTEPGSSIPSLPSPPSPRSLVVEPSSSTIESLPLQPAPAEQPLQHISSSNKSNNSKSNDKQETNSSEVDKDIEGRGPLPISPSTPVPNSRTAYLWNIFRSFLGRVVHIVFKDNNLPLILNIIYHAAAARSLIAEPWLLVNRYIKVPVIQQQPQQHRPLLAAANLATDALRAIGAMHMALGLLATLALKERRIRTEQSALLVLTLASLGQTWAHARAYWSSKYTIRAIQEIGSLDSLVFVVSSIALVKTVRRTGQLL
ncbi:hypothetical protein INT45_011195 [Circinella minor]|uniref:Uncharacterized protein n=1 Tax=Circinella minor TaxID=1195481 RepID=A0A8H7S4H2_9FUNG|nr:hypothetical protein INT45_011195 [Circinella minor]